LDFDERPGHIGGFRFIFSDYMSFEPVEPVSNSYLDRPASGGTPPYSYQSSNKEVAFVNKDGRVYACKNGETEITVIDSFAKTKKFRITTSGNFDEWKYLGAMPQTTAVAKAADYGGKLPGLFDCTDIYKIYKAVPFDSVRVWTSTPHEGLPGYFKTFDFKIGDIRWEVPGHSLGAYAVIPHR